MIELNKKIIEIQKEIPVIKPNKINPYHKNKYADLCAIQSVVLPIINKHECSLIHSSLIKEDGTEILITEIKHENESIKSMYPLKSIKAQERGSELTYGKRYNLSALLAISIQDEDDDGNLAQGVDVKKESNVKQSVESYKQSETKQCTASQAKMLYAKTKAKLGSDEKAKEWFQNKYNVKDTTEILFSKVNDVIKEIENINVENQEVVQW